MIPKEINKIVDRYFEYIELKIPNFIQGYYLYGSVSLGAFTDGLSDIDFVALTNREVSEIDVSILKQIHKDLQNQYPKTSLDGFYINIDDMDSLNKNPSCIRFNDGKFHGYKEFDKNSIDAFQLKKYGITIKGPNIKDLDYTVDWDILISNMKENLNTYWLDWWKDCKRFPSIRYLSLLCSLRMVEWGVLGVSRLYFTSQEKDITSKAGAGEYALKVVPQRWHKIIHESMRLRNFNKKSHYKSVFQRRKDALDYIEYIIQCCNNSYK
jgi:hypothetical protein